MNFYPYASGLFTARAAGEKSILQSHGSHDKACNLCQTDVESFNRQIEMVQYKAVLETTDAKKEISCDKPYQELELESLADRTLLRRP